MNNLSAISWREQVTFQRDGDDVGSFLYQHGLALVCYLIEATVIG
jgi:hypothetical protein